MKIKHYPPGSYVAMIGWDNRPMDLGVVIQQDIDHMLIDTQVLFPSGLRWVGAHDLIPIDSLPPRRNK
jgi:hypothetical protein